MKLLSKYPIHNDKITDYSLDLRYVTSNFTFRQTSNLGLYYR